MFVNTEKANTNARIVKLELVNTENIPANLVGLDIVNTEKPNIDAKTANAFTRNISFLVVSVIRNPKRRLPNKLFSSFLQS